MNIRLYDNDSDRNAVIDLWKSVFSYNTPHNDPPASIDRKLEHNDNLFFVAESGGKKIIGTIMAGYDGHRGWIYSLAVSQGYRNRGTGTLLLRHAENELLKLNCPKIKLQILNSNADVIDFYRKNGYNVEETICMGKTL
ncbi:MAG: GNAT family acetyltransferase [Brevinematales bacterium]|jgi:ribosomal protein S18 acetylase RimI-like enzyme